MTSVATNKADWALTELAGAGRERREIEPLTDTWPELDEATAYAIQKRLVAENVKDESSRISGLKLGLTSVAKQKQMSVGEPIYGVLVGSRLVNEGEPLEIASLIHPKAEPEIAIVTGRDLKGPGVTAEQAREAIDSASCAMEIIDSRFKNFRFTLTDVIADNTSAARHTISTFRVPAQGLDLRTLGVVFEKNGEVVSTAAGAAILGDPALGLAWLANKLADCGESVPAGTVVMTGALTDAIAIAPGDVVRVTIAQLGTLSLRCV
ncbi:MAG TPA: fumarylacetoacetate hydrolase family protein [Candidatus Lustribacter sp.]